MPARTLVVLYPGCIAYEVQLAAELLSPVFPILVATPEGRDHAASNGMRIRADVPYAEVDAGACRAVLLPGGDPREIMNDREIDRLLVAAMEDQAVVGAICAGPLLLAKAGLLKGRRFTHGYGEREREFLAAYFEGGMFEDRPLVWDGNLLTARAQAHIAFAASIAARCGALPKGRTEDGVRAFYEGRHPI